MTHTQARRLKRKTAELDEFNSDPGPRRDVEDDGEAGETSQGTTGIGEQIRSLNTLARSRFKVARSGIHGWVYAASPTEASAP